MADKPAPEAADAPARNALALTEARRSLDGQLGLVEVTRQRAIAIMGLAGLVGAFVGSMGASNAGGHVSCAIWIALITFGMLMVLTVLILWPRQLNADLDPVVLIEDWIPQQTAESLDRVLALRVAKQHADNKSIVDWMVRGVAAMTVLLSIQFVALAVQMIGSK